ncbi:unnamed protein product, partial [Durusdinium trenchii]
MLESIGDPVSALFTLVDAAGLLLAAWVWYQVFMVALAMSPPSPSRRVAFQACVALFEDQASCSLLGAWSGTDSASAAREELDGRNRPGASGEAQLIQDRRAHAQESGNPQTHHCNQASRSSLQSADAPADADAERSEERSPAEPGRPSRSSPLSADAPGDADAERSEARSPAEPSRPSRSSLQSADAPADADVERSEEGSPAEPSRPSRSSLQSADAPADADVERSEERSPAEPG